MKIGFVLDDSLDKPNGVQQHVLTLGEYFRELGHDVHYLVGETKRGDIDNVHSLSKNFTVNFNQNKMSTPLPGNKKSIRDLLTEAPFDIVHVQMPYSPLLAGRIINFAPEKTKIVGTFHIVPFSRLEWFASRILAAWSRRTLKKIDQVISVSLPARQFVLEAFGKSSVVIPNPVNTSKYRKGGRTSHPDKKVQLVFVGRLVPRKGCAYLLQTMRALKDADKLHNVSLVICGTGQLEDKLKKYVMEHDLDNIVSFAGYVSEQQKIDYLSNADIAVMPSTGGESFGIVLIEAMAAGAHVVIAGNNPGYASVLGERPDQLVNPFDIQGFADTLLKFIESPRERLRAKQWQARHVRQYDIQLVGERVMSEYESVLAKQRNN